MNDKYIDNNRIKYIDYFRGFAVISMILANFLCEIQAVPLWLKHSKNYGLTVVDLIAPLFIFAIGLTYKKSVQKRLKNEGTANAIMYIFRRYLAIFGVGSLLSMIEYILGLTENSYMWGVLQAIGVSGIITFPFIFFNIFVRFLISIILMLLYQFVIIQSWSQLILDSPHGGIIGVIGWSIMLILSTILADLFYESTHKKKSFLLINVCFALLGFFITSSIPISKNLINMSYILISLGLSGIVFYLFYYISTVSNSNLGILSIFGKNPLIIYIFHYFILYIFLVPENQNWYIQAPLWLNILQFSFFILSSFLLGYWLDKKKIYISL